jgi:FtsP/CotA-like multicopper oxidase with cupredoxin domain
MRFETYESGHHMSARVPFSPTLYLVRNEPVSIMVVNHLKENTSVHWHGIELESYYDGVAGLSGAPTRLAPIIAPGDSFEARLTPPRSGTFMYHSHVDDVVQQTAGLVGALVVQDGSPGPRPDEHEIFLKGSRGYGTPRTSPLDVNGSMNPDTIVIHAGRPARLRFMSLSLQNPNATVVLTARADSAFRNVPDTLVARWTPVAKDGADLPTGARVPRLARQIIAMGETYDFSYSAPQRGDMRIEIRGAGPRGALLARVPVRVE